MPAVHIRDVPPQTLEALKRRASRHHRSLQMELLQILDQIALREPLSEVLPPISLKTSGSLSTGAWRREEIYGDDGR